MKNDFDKVVPQPRLRFQSRISGFPKGVRVIALIGLTFSFAPARLTSSVAPAQQQSVTLLDRMHSAALENKIAIKSAPTPPPAASVDSSASASTAETPIVMNRLAMMQTPMGYMATAPLNGLTSGSYAIVYGDGAVTATTENGDVIWNHGSLDFTQWTGRYPPYQNGNVVIFNPSVQLGLDPIDPFQHAGEHPFATGDLTGDGIDDLAVAHFFTPGANAIAGVGGSLVTVLDGSSGNLVWSRMYPGYVNNLAIDDAMLVVADDTGDLQGPVGIQIGENGSRSSLDCYKFELGGGSIHTVLRWSISTGAQWAPWLALEKLPNGKIAAAWTNSASGSGAATLGHELVISLATGATDWSVATTGYPRRLRFDSTRNQVVAIEGADTAVTFAYSIVARDLSNGNVVTTIAEDSATAVDLQVGDLDGDGQAEYVVADVAYLPCAPAACLGLQNSGRVLAINPTTGTQEWSQVRGTQPVDPNNPLAGTDIPRSYGLLLVSTASGADVLVGTFVPGGNMELERLNGALNLNGAGGTVLWSRSAPNLFLPFFISLYEKDGAHFVRTAASRPHYYGGGLSIILDNLGAQLVLDGLTPFQVVRSFNATTGNQVSAVPLLGRIHAVTGTDVSGDGKSDLVVGGESNGVFALDGNKIDQPSASSSPAVLWRASVAGPVHQIAAGDLDGDGYPEIVVAATHAIDVLDAATGNLRYEIPSASDYLWNFLLADLNNDGKLDIVVPGSASINAYAGQDGTTLWNYTPSGAQAAALFSNVEITPNKVITAQFAYGTQNPLQRTGGGYSRGVVGINGPTGAVLWSDANASSATASWFPQFWHGTVAGQLDGVTGSIVGYSWVGYDYSKDVGGVCDSCFTPAMEIRDALSGTIINSLPLPWIYNGSMGTLLIPEKGILSYAGNASWLLTPTLSGQALGHDIPLDMAEGNFGALGKHVVEEGYPWYVEIFPQNGIDVSGWNVAVPHAAIYYHAIAPTRVFLQDLDGDGVDEIIRAQFDYDGNSSLVAAIQGFGYEPKPYSDGLDIVEVTPAPVPLNSVVSRKTHGTAGTFDLLLSSGTPATIEPRAGGITSGDHTLVFSFLNVVSAVNSVTATATTSSGTVPVTVLNTSGIGTDTHQYIVNLSGVPNASHLNVTLNSVTDSANDVGDVSAHMDVLLGDVNFTGRTDSGDVTAVRNRTVTIPDQQNFQFDVNTSGRIDAGDVTVTRNASVTVLPQ
jgi:hypothetical protein